MYDISRNSQFENKNDLSAHCNFGQMIPTHSRSVKLSFNSQLETTKNHLGRDSLEDCLYRIGLWVCLRVT